MGLLEDLESGKRIIDVTPSVLPSFKGLEEEADEYLDIKFCHFSSSAQIPTIYARPNNMDYFLRFYLPRKARIPIEYLFIMLNGMGDTDPKIYDDMGFELSKDNIASVLFPLPDHFHRRDDFVCHEDDTFVSKDKFESILSLQGILSEVAAFPERLIYGYQHIMADLSIFMNIFKQEKPLNVYLYELFNQFFSRNTKICLMGYSLGGLVALAYTLLYPDHIHSSYLIESGANLDQINAGILFQRSQPVVDLIWKKRIVDFVTLKKKKIQYLKYWLVCEHDPQEDRDEFERIIKEVENGKPIEEVRLSEGRFVRTVVHGEKLWYNIVMDIMKKYEKSIKVELPPELSDIFEKIVFGDRRTLYKKDLKDACSKVFIILGGSDVLFTMEAIMSFAPRETGLAILQIPKLGHWLRFRDHGIWRQYKGFIIKTIIEFARVLKDR